MKLYILLIAIGVLIIGASLSSKADSTETMKFITSGNCIVCEGRIEENVKKLAGITYVYWDSKAKVTTVTFDTTKMDIYTIMKKIASVGHDTEWFKGDDAYYTKQLIGTCCEYPRTIDYSTAKVGYLSLMDKWVSVNTIEPNKINLYSSNNGNLLNYNITGFENNSISITIYSLLGDEVYISSNVKPNGEIDLSQFPVGTYIVTMANQNKTVFTQKIIK
jgi:copper chaperone CopZ